MNLYMTQQRKILYSFFQKNIDKQFAVRDIVATVKDCEISLSAVYRNLGSLEKNGLIRRSIKEGSRECVYQYIHPEECQSHIHMECQGCGDTFHLDDSIAEAMRSAVRSVSGFTVCSPKTVLYGNCKDCESKT